MGGHAGRADPKPGHRLGQGCGASFQFPAAERHADRVGDDPTSVEVAERRTADQRQHGYSG